MDDQSETSEDAQADDLEPPRLDPESATNWAGKDRIVVRIEVTDTGCGIHPNDMNQTKLFCMSFYLSCTSFLTPSFFIAAFNQTERGRIQGNIFEHTILKFSNENR